MRAAQEKAVPRPQFTKDTMPAVSPTLKCCMSLLAQYFVIYSILAISASVNKARPTTLGSKAEEMFKTAATTVTFAPMLAVMFLGTRMRAIQLTQGETEKYGLPQWWVQASMYVCTYTLLAQLLVLMVTSVVLGSDADGEDESAAEEEGDEVDGEGKTGPKAPALVLMALRYVCMAFLYGGLIVVLAGVTLMQGPTEIWGKEFPPVSPAVKCTMTLCLTFFGIYLGLAFSQSALELFPNHRWEPLFTKMEAVFSEARFTVNMSPMLAVLFVGARVRALQIDPKWGNPPIWAQGAFFLCTFSVVFQAFFATFGPLICECKVFKGECDGDIEFKFTRRTWTGFFAILRYISLGAIYVGIGVVMASVFFMQHPDGPEMTPPISPAMKCVMFLTVQYFFVYTGQMVCVTVNSMLEDDTKNQDTILRRLIHLFGAAREPVMFAPMLAILFIGCRMRALQLTKADDGTIPTTAGPQPWAQKAMYVASLSVLVQVAMVMLIEAVYGRHHKASLDKGGTRNSVSPRDGAVDAKLISTVSFEVLHYCCLLAMYAGAIVIMVAICVMTPETLPPYVYAK